MTTPNTVQNPGASTQVPPPNPDMAIMAGAPAEGFPSGNPGSSQSVASPQNQPNSPSASPTKETAAPVASPIFLGSRKFNTIEELAAYTATLEPKAALADRMGQVVNPAVTQTFDADDQLADLIYTNPKEAIRQIKAGAVHETTSLIQQQKAGQDLRDRFFNQYTDLKGSEDIVEFYYGRMQKELANLNEADATSKLANAVRSRLATIKGTQTATEELPNGRPVTVGQSSGAPTSTPGAPPKTMLEQMKNWQAGKRSGGQAAKR